MTYFIILAGIVALILSIWKMEWAIVFLALVSMNQYAIQIGPGKLAAGELSAILIFLVWILKKRRLKVDTLLIFNLLFIGCGFLSIINTPNLLTSLKEIFQMTVYFIMIYLVIINNVTNNEQIKRLVLAFLIGGFLVAFIGVVQYIVGNARTFSIFYNPNVFGGFLALVLPLIITLSNNFKMKAVGVVVFMGLLSTMSRGSVLGASLANILISLLGKKLQILYKTVIFFLFAIILVGGLGRFLYMKNRIFDSHTTNVRISLWQASWRMISSHPLTGVGIGTYAENLPFYAPQGTEMQDTAHNLYLNIAAEMGIPGLLVYLSILVIILSRAIKNHQTLKDEYLKCLNLGLLGGVIAFSVSNLFTPLMLRGVAIPLWIFIGLITVISKMKDEKL
jgi:putative inorganic carbon (HCO3(-)) transporter